MHKKLGAALLVAGTCIGSGMIALPMVLAKVGLLPSVLLMVAVWFVMYYTSLVNLELNLQVGHGISLGGLGRHFSGKTAELMGTISLKLLSYSLLAVFIYGGSSVIQELVASKMAIDYPFGLIGTTYAIIVTALLWLPIQWIDYVNRMLFLCLLAAVAMLIGGLAITVEWSDLPLYSQQYSDPRVWAALIPVVFTSFGFQVIFHTVSNYCDMEARVLKKAFFWGSLIPLAVYILWTCSTLSVVYHDNPEFYSQMVAGKVEVGELIQQLGGIAKSQPVQLLVWWISLLAIATSVLGVGVGLCDSLKKMLGGRVANRRVRTFLASVITVLPSYLVVMFVPNAFIAVLGFAGMILAVIAVLLPVYLFRQVQTDKLHYAELRCKPLVWLSTAAAAAVIICELYNML